MKTQYIILIFFALFNGFSCGESSIKDPNLEDTLSRKIITKSEKNIPYFWLDTTYTHDYVTLFEDYYNSLCRVGRPFDDGHYSELRIFFHVHFGEDFLYVLQWHDEKEKIIAMKTAFSKYGRNGSRACSLEKAIDPNQLSKDILSNYLNSLNNRYQNKAFSIIKGDSSIYWEIWDNHLVIEYNTNEKDFIFVMYYTPENLKKQDYLFNEILAKLPYKLPPHQDIVDAFPLLEKKTATKYMWECYKEAETE